MIILNSAIEVCDARNDAIEDKSPGHDLLKNGWAWGHYYPMQ
ncbi:MAG TPA: hypothetical protein PKM63_20695 [Panacibacter sp.]|nr:hypothetical protein [Panacibacter sp.]HNP46728.1 hypothetical protein [Panacibacter sp.]